MKKKFFLPVMAMVVAIGMSFATESSTADPNNDYVMTPDGWRSVAEVEDCGDKEDICEAQINLQGDRSPVFDSLADLAANKPKTGGNLVERIITD